MRSVPTAMPVSSATSPIPRCSIRPLYGVGAHRGSFDSQIGYWSGAMARILLTGATGYVGGQLLPKLLQDGHDVRCLVRDTSRDLPDGAEKAQGDAVSGDGLEAAADGMDVAYYLIHSMEGKGGGFADRDKQAAANFARAAGKGGVRRVVYLGGLPSNNGLDSEHLRSRNE